MSEKERGHVCQLRDIRTDGTVIDVEIYSSAISIGRERAILTTVRDITKRKRAEEALAEQGRLANLGAEVGNALTRGKDLQEMLRLSAEAMVKHLGAAFARIWTLNKEQNTLELQASAGMYTHIDGAHGRVAVGQYKIGLIAQEKKPYLTNAVIGDPRLHDQEWAKREGMVAFAGYPMMVENEVVGVMAMFARRPLSDFTIKALGSVADEIALGIRRMRVEDEIRQLNKELEQRVEERTADLAAVNKELEAFSYSVSHDLRAPLRAINGFSQLLLEDCVDKLDERGKDHLQHIRAASERMGGLIDDILQLSRITRQEIRRTKVDLSQMAGQIMGELQTADPRRKVDLRIAPRVVAHGDPVLLRQVLQNLLQNAWKFTSKKASARIELGSAQREGKTIYFVRDNGAGFDMAYADKLFGVFQRLHSPKEFEGTGIGLATVQRIIHRHGGSIWAESEVDKGATFYFTL